MGGSQWLHLPALRIRTKRPRKEEKKTVIVGLKSGDNSCRDMLLRVLTLEVKSGDKVLAIHVQESNEDTFDPSTFPAHEDLCKSKQVDFQVKVCVGECYVSELCHQARVNYATILVLGCSSSRPKESVVSSCVKGLPFCCTLLVMDTRGRARIKRHGTSQQGSVRLTHHHNISSSSSSRFACLDQSETPIQLHSFTFSSSSSSSKSCPVHGDDDMAPTFKLLERLVFLELEGRIKRFSSEELSFATSEFSSEMLIGDSNVYRATLGDGMLTAVKVLKTTEGMEGDYLREVEVLSSIKHENIVQIVGYCYEKEMNAIVYNSVKGSLEQNLKQLGGSARMSIAIGVAKALEYLHHRCSPPIIHGNLKSSNILLTDNSHPRLSDFGAATKQFNANNGMVDEKSDVYSYGVVLLELITGKEAMQENPESLVLWARPLLGCGTSESLIDPCLYNNAYSIEEMELMMIAASLCLIDSASRRPTMKLILKLFEEPENWLKKLRERNEALVMGM